MTLHKLRTTVAGPVVILVTVASAPAVVAAPVLTPRHVISSATASPSSAAADASAEARTLRRAIASTLQGYLDQYGSRFTDSERATLAGYRADADRQLAAVVVTTSRLKSALSGRASATQRTAASVAAVSAWKRAKTSSDETWAKARQIMEPKLSMFEKFGALNDYNSMMGRFDDLGDSISRATGMEVRMGTDKGAGA